MKTITEFHATRIKSAIQTQKQLSEAGKTAEELPAALGEALKLEGDKLQLLLNALAALEERDAAGKKSQDLKRVVAYTAQEGEKTQAGLIQKGEHWFSIEYYPPLNPPPAKRGKRPFGDKGKNARGGKGRRDNPRFKRGEAGKPGESATGDAARRDSRPPRGRKPFTGKKPVTVIQVSSDGPRIKPVTPIQQPATPSNPPAAQEKTEPGSSQ